MKGNTKGSFIKSLGNFIAFSNDLIRFRKFDHLKASFGLIEGLMEKGEPGVKMAIVGRYIPALQKLLEGCEWRKEVVSLFPIMLRKEFNRQSRKKRSREFVR